MDKVGLINATERRKDDQRSLVEDRFRSWIDGSLRVRVGHEEHPSQELLGSLSASPKIPARLLAGHRNLQARSPQLPRSVGAESRKTFRREELPSTTGNGMLPR